MIIAYDEKAERWTVAQGGSVFGTSKRMEVLARKYPEAEIKEKAR